MANPRSSHQPTSKVIPSAHARRREQFLTSRPSADEILQIVRSVTNTTTTTHPPPPPPQTPAGALLDETRYKKSLTAFAVLVRAHHTTPLPHRSTAPPPHHPTTPPPHHPTAPPPHRPTAAPPHRPTTPPPNCPTVQPLFIGSTRTSRCSVEGCFDYDHVRCMDVYILDYSRCQEHRR